MTAKYPHCNMTVLHAPGECFFCDKYPNEQQDRIRLGVPFTPNIANGWSGNVAQDEHLRPNLPDTVLYSPLDAQLTYNLYHTVYKRTWWQRFVNFFRGVN